MALEAVVFQQDLLGYSFGDTYNTVVGGGGGGGGGGGCGPWIAHGGFELEEDENPCGHESIIDTAGEEAPVIISTAGQRKRRRSRSVKNREEVEQQRLTHITVERNRRKQMNDYLAVLRSLMPPSYVQRGDQASIIGGAINFVKELEQLLQSLEGHKKMKKQTESTNLSSELFSDFFSFPQYSTRRNNSSDSPRDQSMTAEKPSSSAIAEVEVTMVESHANLKILSRRHPRQLLRMVEGLFSLCFSILHINLTAVDHMVLYSFSVKVEDACQLTSVNEIAAAVYDMVGRIQDEATSSFSHCDC